MKDDYNPLKHCEEDWDDFGIKHGRGEEIEGGGGAISVGEG